MDPENVAEQRNDARKGFLKRAQIINGSTALDCVVENLSAAGARLRFGVPMLVPETFVQRFSDGASHPARRRWARGAAVGIVFEGDGQAGETVRRHLAEAVRDAFQTADPSPMLVLLRTARFFGDEALRQAAADPEMAQARFTNALASHMPPRKADAP